MWSNCLKSSNAFDMQRKVLVWCANWEFNKVTFYYITPPRQVHWNMIWKKPRIFPIWGQSDPLWSQTYHPWVFPINYQCRKFILKRQLHCYQCQLREIMSNYWPTSQGNYSHTSSGNHRRGGRFKLHFTAGTVVLAPKWVRLGLKLDKYGTFSDQISVHLAHRAKCTEIWS